MHNLGVRTKGPRPPVRALDIGQYDLATLAGRLNYAMDLRNTNPNKIELSTGIRRQTLYAVQRGKTQIFTYEVLLQITSHLGVRPDWLAKGQMPIHPPPELKDDDEIQLIHDFRDMTPAHQRDLAKIARDWAEEDGGEPNAGRPFYPRPRRPQ